MYSFRNPAVSALFCIPFIFLGRLTESAFSQQQEDAEAGSDLVAMVVRVARLQTLKTTFFIEKHNFHALYPLTLLQISTSLDLKDTVTFGLQRLRSHLVLDVFLIVHL